MIYYEVKDEKSRVLASSLETCPTETLALFDGREKENVRIKSVRNAHRSIDGGEVRLVITEDKELENSTRGIARVANVYLSMIPEFRKIARGQRQHVDVIIKRFVHNLVDVQKRFKGNIQRLVPDSSRERSYDDLVRGVEERIKKDTRSAAEDFWQVAHRATDFDAQLAGLRVISGLAEELKPSLIRINIRKALFRFQQPFAKEFRAKNVGFDIQIDNEQAERNRLQLDPDLLNVAFSQFFQNAVKYVCPNTDVVVSAVFDEERCALKFVMQSTCIEADEVDKIFKENYKGRHSGNLAGDGIGMFIVRRALNVMDAQIRVEPNTITSVIMGEQKYCANTFVIDFKRNKTL